MSLGEGNVHMDKPDREEFHTRKRSVAAAWLTERRIGIGKGEKKKSHTKESWNLSYGESR